MKYFIFLIIFSFANCNKNSDNNQLVNSKIEYTFLKEKKHTNPLIRGIWKSIGNGYFLEVREDSILLYSYTKSYCYKEKNDYLEGLLNSQSQFILRQDTVGIYLTDYGGETTALQSKKDFIKIDKLPENCLSFNEMTSLNEKELFNLYQETIEENYAFANERQLNWAQTFKNYQDSNLSADLALFESMGEIATLTKDQHTKVIAQDGSRLQYRITPSALIVQSVFEKQTKVKDLNEYFNLFFNSNSTNISDSLLMGKGKKVLNGNIEWGNINDKVGYINISSFAGFLNQDFTRTQQIDSIKFHMNEIVTNLQQAEAIIVDVSFNFGGFDASALTIASYFTDKPIFAYTSQVFNNGEFYNEDKVFVYPSEKPFTKPVYVLMTDISRSAAECFAMMMEPLPNVQLVGTSTLGTLSGMLGKSIGGFYTTYSNQRLVNSAGDYFEVKGVTPDIELTVFEESDIMNAHLNTVKKIVNDIENKKKN